MTTIPTMTAPPSISPSSTSSSPLPPPLRYVPQGTASLSSDAPGWSAATVANDEENSAAAAAAVRGPVCWKCRGGRFLAAVSATSSLPRPRGQSKTKRANNQHHNDNNNDDEIIASLLQPQPRPRQQLRECPVCAGAGHLPIKLKYLQSMTEMTGVITPRRRGRSRWRAGAPARDPSTARRPPRTWTEW